jgi:RNA polymerase sigma-70 factor (ECF subfamily)
VKEKAMTDRELVLSCLQGQLESYAELMARYGLYAMTVAFNILLNREDAEDVCQDAFLKVYQNLEKFDTQQSFKNWFYALLCNLCLDRLRKKRRSQNLLARYFREAQAESSTWPGPSALEAGLDLGRLRHLAPKERLALYLWSQEGYSGAEIASVLECSRRTAHIHLFRARQKLKAAMRENRYG